MTIIKFDRADATHRSAPLDDVFAASDADHIDEDGAADGLARMTQAPATAHAHVDTASDAVSVSSPVGEFLEQFDVAAPGEFIAYHVGDLAADCEVGEGARDIRACKAIAMGLFQDREAHLVQRRFGPHRYVYYAVKR